MYRITYYSSTGTKHSVLATHYDVEEISSVAKSHHSSKLKVNIGIGESVRAMEVGESIEFPLRGDRSWDNIRSYVSGLGKQFGCYYRTNISKDKSFIKITRLI